MNWARTLTAAVLGCTLSVLIVLAFVLVGLYRIDQGVQAQRRDATRSACVTETYAPFWSHLAIGLRQLDADGDISPVISEALAVDAVRLQTVNERCTP